MKKRELFLDNFYLSAFQEYLMESQHSLRTIENYLDNVILFIEFFNAEYNPTQVAQNDIVDYIKYCQDIQKLNVSSINLRLFSLKSYFNFLYEVDLIKIDPAKSIKKIKDNCRHEVKIFDKKTYRAVRRLIYSTGNPLHIAIWETLTLCGVKVEELCNLKLDNLIINKEKDYTQSSRLSFTDSRGNCREIHLCKDCKSAILNWLRIRKDKKSTVPFIFINARKGKFTRSGISRIIKKYYVILGVEDRYTVNSCSYYYIIHSTTSSVSM